MSRDHEVDGNFVPLGGHAVHEAERHDVAAHPWELNLAQQIPDFVF